MNALSGSKGQYGIPCVTLDGITVKSLKEKTIADYLFRHGVSYKYEKVVIDPASNKPVAKPDFYLPDFDIYIEYWGRLDDEKYSFDMRRKKQIYKKLNCKLISIYEKNIAYLDWIVTKEVKAQTGRDLFTRNPSSAAN